MKLASILLMLLFVPFALAWLWVLMVLERFRMIFKGQSKPSDEEYYGPMA